MFEVIPWSSLFGGILLGISAVLLLLFNGKVAGISGVLNGLLANTSGDRSWRALFLIGLLVGGGVAIPLLDLAIPQFEQTSMLTFVVAGLLVGIGTRIGNGCTSGHGICGMGRLSKRSIVATLTFMAVAAVTVFIRLHLI
ncbi:YeeE/YedE family protein [Vibrio maerlii]|uniref:YeeE/YedE family protein n=1 Tax=Vibrio maerlii TaxID=2231648 RepID=UPI000E3D0B5E|nr:YeeE/YedE family protein [Vibrio maerlii]